VNPVVMDRVANLTENCRELPRFRVISIVSDFGQAKRMMEIARGVPHLGLAMMLRDPDHRFEAVRTFFADLSKETVPDNLALVTNGGVVAGGTVVHWQSKQLAQLISSHPLSAVAVSEAGQLQGASVHCAEELAIASLLPLDYLIASPVFSPRSKHSPTTLGLEGLYRICSGSKVPVFALGGITGENARSCIDAGAYGVAAISWFQHDSVDQILRALDHLFVP
jgi:hypothetical protein